MVWEQLRARFPEVLSTSGDNVATGILVHGDRRLGWRDMHVLLVEGFGFIGQSGLLHVVHEALARLVLLCFREGLMSSAVS